MAKIVELAKRCGLRASDVDGELRFIDKPTSDAPYGRYELIFLDCCTIGLEDKTDRFLSLLGLDQSKLTLTGNVLGDLEDKVDKALVLAPRARTH